MTFHALQELTSATMEDKEAIVKTTSINLTLYPIITQAQEENLVLFKQVQELQAEINFKKPAAKKPTTHKK